MAESSCDVIAIIHSIHGEGEIDVDSLLRVTRSSPTLDTLRFVICNEDLAEIIAMMNHVHPTVRVVAALASGLIELIDADEKQNRDVHAALQILINAREGEDALESWSLISPAEWGKPFADDLIDAATNDRYNPGVVAALIGACDAAAMLLDAPNDIAYAIRRWGQTSSNDPMTWTTCISTRSRRQIMHTLRQHPPSLAACLPWLPVEDGADIDRIASYDVVTNALEAFTESSPAARRQHAALMQHIVQYAQPAHLDSLVRIACAMDSTEDAESVWQRVAALLPGQYDAAGAVVAAAPWDRLPRTVQKTILSGANRSDICAAIAVAQGMRTTARITPASAAAFFSALSPNIWKGLDHNMQRQWLAEIHGTRARFAVRSIGLKKEVLAHAIMENDLVAAARLHVNNSHALRDALLPVALSMAPLRAVHALISALPDMPSDPEDFFFIASRSNASCAVGSVRTILQTPTDLADAIILQRTQGDSSCLYHACVTLATVLRGRSWESLETVVSLLDANAHADIMPDRDVLAAKLAPPKQQDKMRQALNDIVSLSPDVAIPAVRAIQMLGRTWSAPDALMFALRNHGSIALAFVHALTDDMRHAIFPSPPHRKLANALRDVMKDAPVAASYLAHALAARQWASVSNAMLAMPATNADAIASALPRSMRDAILEDAAQYLPYPAILAVAARDFIIALALAALASDDDMAQKRGRAALIARSMRIRTIWTDIPPSIRATLLAHDTISAIINDVLDHAPSPRASNGRGQRTPGKQR